jgi:hypothetical protein
MTKKILVPMAQRDEIEEMIPYIEKVAQAGMKVVFLMRYPARGIKWPTKEPDTETASELQELLGCYCWEANLRRAEAKVAHAIKAFEEKGIEAAVDVYAGSLKKAVRSHSVSGDVLLLLMRVAIRQRIAAFFSTSLFQSFKGSTASPALLIHIG